MNTPNASKATHDKTLAKTNGSTSGDQAEQPVASTTAAGSNAPTVSAPDKKPTTVMLSEQIHRKAKILTELSGSSLSELMESQLKIIVRERLPGLLAALDAES